jgi:hypothetical protein
VVGWPLCAPVEEDLKNDAQPADVVFQARKLFVGGRLIFPGAEFILCL